MRRANGGFQESGREAHESEDAGGTQRARWMPRGNGRLQDIPLRTLAANSVRAKKQSESENPERRAGDNSGTTARRMRRNEPLRKNIIGRKVPVRGSGVGVRRISGDKDVTLALFNETASEIGRGLLLQPLLEELSNLLAKIGGVSEAGELVRLKGVAGSGEQELPRSLGARLGHSNLRGAKSQEYEEYIIHKVIDKASKSGTIILWKSVEKKENSAECCSGCAGDYEDPDRSAWEADVEEEEGDIGDGKGQLWKERGEGQETVLPLGREDSKRGMKGTLTRE